MSEYEFVWIPFASFNYVNCSFPISSFVECKTLTLLSSTSSPGPSQFMAHCILRISIDVIAHEFIVWHLKSIIDDYYCHWIEYKWFFIVNGNEKAGDWWSQFIEFNLSIVIFNCLQWTKITFWYWENGIKITKLSGKPSQLQMICKRKQLRLLNATNFQNKMWRNKRFSGLFIRKCWQHRLLNKWTLMSQTKG